MGGPSRISLLSIGLVPWESGLEKALRCTAVLPGLRAGRSSLLGLRNGRLVVVVLVLVVEGFVVVVVDVEGVSADCTRIGGTKGLRDLDPAPG